MAENQPNPYGFITDAPQPTKKTSLGPEGSNSVLMRALLVVGGVITLIIILVVFFSFLNSASNTQNQRLLEIAQTQTEMIRIAEASKEKTTSSEAATLVTNVAFSTKSSLTDTTAAIAKRGKKPDPKMLTLGVSAESDKLLTDAEQSGRFDEVYSTLLKQQLTNYQKLLEAAHSSGSAKEKEFLSEAFEQSKILLEEVELIQS